MACLPALLPLPSLSSYRHASSYSRVSMFKLTLLFLSSNFPTSSFIPQAQKWTSFAVALPHQIPIHQYYSFWTFPL
jgi:hypothetical protein